jgi:hypothetical protein
LLANRLRAFKLNNNVIADGVVEGSESVTYTLLDAAGYAVDSTTNNGNDTIYGNGGAGNNTIFLGAGDAAIALNRGGFDTVNNFQLGSSRFFVGSLLNDLSFADSSSGVRISAANDLLAVVSNQSASTFSSNSSSWSLD